jgi:hypothetical protein
MCHGTSDTDTSLASEKYKLMQMNKMMLLDSDFSTEHPQWTTLYLCVVVPLLWKMVSLPSGGIKDFFTMSPFFSSGLISTRIDTFLCVQAENARVHSF